MGNKYETSLKIMADKNTDDEMKVFLILELLHEKRVSLKKAMELCTKFGIFSDHWITIDAKIVEIWSRY